MPGYVYVASNPAYSYLNVGMTEREPTERVQQLSNSTSTPHPFELLYYAEFKNATSAEREIHQRLRAHRTNPNRE
ncbi:MAG: GIY-YIG nuclease family protein, partial [Phycisphaerae bacterium]|nr:GIY-YIG nuclease family protein [Phycisphaerae bacterium]NIP50971.1 GIY-YIG nuclease family protein [Phycisphaerae bacterium]NIU07815.1 GIY-YIG nuclease family protein [Phycisphaerae bacterium]NIW97390.1 hypothetical protein [Phycisphaerae bacterium]NIX26814.1 hypothetical protein [Phycisphaerae bacterium]